MTVGRAYASLASQGEGDLLADGSRPMTAAWNFGNQNLTNVAKLGIGTSDPDALVQIGSNAAFAMPAGTDLWMQNDLRFSSGADTDSTYGTVFKPGWTGSVSQMDIGFRHAGTDTMLIRLSSSGMRLQRGAIAETAALLHVAATGNANALRVSDSTGTSAFGTTATSSYQLTVNGLGGSAGAVFADGVASNNWGFVFSGGTMVGAGLSMDGANGSAMLLRSGGTTSVMIRTEAVSYINSGFNFLVGTATDWRGTLQVLGPYTGQIELRDNITDTVDKIGSIVATHKTNAQAPISMIWVQSTTSNTHLRIGGGDPVFTAAVQTSIWAAGTTTTTTGTSMVMVTTTGMKVQAGISSGPSALLHVAAAGNANALRVKDSTGNLGIKLASNDNYSVIIGAGTSGTCYANSVGAGQWAYLFDGGTNTGSGFLMDGANGSIMQLKSGTTTAILFRTEAESYINTTPGLVIGATSKNSSAIVQIDSTTRGFAPPRMTTTQRDAIGTPLAGLVIYNTTTNKLNVYTTAWEAVTSA